MKRAGPTKPRARKVPKRKASRASSSIADYKEQLQTQVEQLRDAQADLEESRDRYAALYDDAPVGYVSLTDHGRITDINLTGAALLGYPRSFLKGMVFNMFTSRRDDARNFLAHLRRGRADGAAATTTILDLKKKDKSIFPARLVTSPLSGNGETLFLTVITDLTLERRVGDALLSSQKALSELNHELEGRVKKRTEALRKSEALRKTVFDAISSQIVVIDRQGGVIETNTAWKQAENTEAGACLNHDALGPNYFAMCERAKARIVDGAEEIIEAIRGVLRGKLDHASVEYWRPDGSTGDRWFSVTVTPLPDRAGAVLLHDDVTLHKQIKRQILESSERERRMLGQELHDTVCQHLSGVAMIAKGLGDSLARTEPEAGAKVLEVSDMVRSGVDQVRAIARGLHPVELETGGLVSAFEELAAQTSARVPCKFKCDGEITMRDKEVEANLYRIAQEAVNNAIKHAQPSEIIIMLRVSAGHVVLAVEDDGTGFPNGGQGSKGMGLHIMKYRASSIGARFGAGNRPRRGAWIRCIVPIQSFW